MGNVYLWGKNGFVLITSLVCYIACFLVPGASCLCLDFVVGDFVGSPLYAVYNRCYEEFVWVVGL